MVSTVCRSWVLPASVQMGQGKAVSGHDQGQDDLLAVAAVIPGIAPAGQVVLLGQALEVGAGQVIEQQVVVELEQRAELVLQVVLDRLLSGQQAIQGAVQAVLGHGAVGDAEQVFQAGGGDTSARPGRTRCRGRRGD